MRPSRWVLMCVTIALAYFASTVLIPIFLAVFIAVLLEPVVQTLAHGRITRAIAIYVVVGLVGIGVFSSAWLFYSSAVSLVDAIPNNPRFAMVAEILQKQANKLELSTQVLGGPVDKTPVQRVEVVQKVPAWTSYFLRGFNSIFELIGIGIFVPLLIFYFLLDKENLIESLNSLIGNYFYLPTLNSELPKMIRAFFSANIFTGLIMIVTQGVMLYAMGFSNFLPLAVITGLTNLIPLIGAPLAILVPMAVGLQAPGVTFPYLALAVSMLFTHLVANNLILPQLMGIRVNINTATLIVGLLFWGWLWGAMGFLLAIPMTALLKIFLESNAETMPISNLMAARPNLVMWNRSLSDDDIPVSPPASHDETIPASAGPRMN